MKNKNMTYEEISEIEGLPVSVRVTPEKKDPYGQVPGLDADELADPEELERQVYREMMAPIMRLPDRFKSCGLRPERDEQGAIEWGAFGSMDFLRDRPLFMDRTRYKLVFLKEELMDQIIAISLIKPRLKGQAYAQVLKHLEMDIISMDDVTDFWMKRMAMRYFKAKRLREEIKKLKAWLKTRPAP